LNSRPAESRAATPTGTSRWCRPRDGIRARFGSPWTLDSRGVEDCPERNMEMAGNSRCRRALLPGMGARPAGVPVAATELEHCTREADSARYRPRKHRL
jgi:hypothetical protein